MMAIMSAVFFVHMGLFLILTVYQVVFSLACILGGRHLGRISLGPLISFAAFIAAVFVMAFLEDHLDVHIPHLIIAIPSLAIAATAIGILMRDTGFRRILAVGSVIYSLHATMMWALIPDGSIADEPSESILLSPDKIRLDEGR